MFLLKKKSNAASFNSVQNGFLLIVKRLFFIDNGRISKFELSLRTFSIVSIKKETFRHFNSEFHLRVKVSFNLKTGRLAVLLHTRWKTSAIIFQTRKQTYFVSKCFRSASFKQKTTRGLKPEIISHLITQ